MTIDNVHKMVVALNKLGTAIDAASASLTRHAPLDEPLRARVASYKEILRRQRELLRDLACASHNEDWSEVSRLTNLVHGASLLIKVDAGFLVSTLKNYDSNYHA
jgi:hypothetical protein